MKNVNISFSFITSGFEMIRFLGDFIVISSLILLLLNFLSSLSTGLKIGAPTV